MWHIETPMKPPLIKTQALPASRSLHVPFWSQSLLFTKGNYPVFCNDNFLAFHHGFSTNVCSLKKYSFASLKFYINTLKPWVFFYILHILLSILFVRCIHAVACSCTLLIFIAVHILVYVYSITHSPISTLLSMLEPQTSKNIPFTFHLTLNFHKHSCDPHVESSCLSPQHDLSRPSQYFTTLNYTHAHACTCAHTHTICLTWKLCVEWLL